MKTLMIIAVVVGGLVMFFVHDQQTFDANQMHQASITNQQLQSVKDNCKRVNDDVVCEVR